LRRDRRRTAPAAAAIAVVRKVINLVHSIAPDAKICFNTTPADTAEAVQRRVKP
jgi:hypothetical protein